MLYDLTIWDFAAISVKLILYFCCYVISGSALFILLNPALDLGLKVELRRLVLMLSIFAIAASLTQTGVQAGRLLDDSIGGMLDSEMLTLVFETPLGEAVVTRIVGLVLVVTFALSTPFSGVLGGIGAALIAASFALVGHGTQEPRWLMTSLVTIHLLAVSFWIGALWPLRRAAHGAIDIQDAGKLAHRFGKQASIIVPLLLIIGVILTYQLVGSAELMFGSQYGLLLVLKLALVAALLTLAAANKSRFVPTMLAGDKTGALRLRRSINIEGMIFLTIFSVTAFLTTVTALPKKTDGMQTQVSEGDQT